MNGQRGESKEYEATAFDNEDNLLRKAADKVRREKDDEMPDFYDPEEDEDNEHWVLSLYRLPSPVFFP